MNYVKHLSIALLVLGTASVFAAAPGPVVDHYTTPKGTKVTLKADKSGWEIPKPGYTVTVDNGSVTVVDASGNAVALTAVAKAEAKSVLAKVKQYYADNITNGSVKVRAAHIAPVVALAAGVAYKTVPAFKDAVDNAAQSVQDFAVDVKDDNGNARRNLAIGATAGTIAGLAGYYYKYSELPLGYFKKA